MSNGWAAEGHTWRLSLRVDHDRTNALECQAFGAPALPRVVDARALVSLVLSLEVQAEIVKPICHNQT